MGSYTGIPDPQQRAKAVAGVALVHVALAALILSGLNVTAVRKVAETLTTIAIAPPPPPPPPKPPPSKRPERAKLDEGAAGKQAEPTKIVAPPVRTQPVNPLPAAPVAGSGSQASAGAAAAGSGTGAGGSGTGRGGGGTGDTSRYTPARLVRNIGRSDYASIVGGRIPVGSAEVSLGISATGAIADCRLLRSSGDGEIDRGLCPLLARRLLFRPALDDRGRPISYRTNYHASWRLRF
ncbi:MAG: hypothetical protein ABIO29_06220 [Sphingomicrobium sp.]